MTWAFIIEVAAVLVLVLTWVACCVVACAAFRRRRRYHAVRSEMRFCRHAWVTKTDGRRLYVHCLHCGAESPGVTVGRTA